MSMKKQNKMLSVVLIIVLIAAILPAASVTAAAPSTTYYGGVPNGDAIIKAAAFTDIRGNTNADNIMKMAAYSIIREYGAASYRPNAVATRQDVLSTLVRAIGKEAGAVAQGNTIKLQDPLLDTVGAYMRGSIEVAKTSGIITQAEMAPYGVLTKADTDAVNKEIAPLVKKNWKMTLAEKAKLVQARSAQKSYDKTYKTAANREQIAVWTAKALSLPPVTGEKISKVYNYTDWKQIKAENLPYVEAVLQSDIMKGAAANKFSPAGSVTRSELAAILNNVANQELGVLGYTTGYGRVTDKSLSKNQGPLGQTLTTNITIESPAGDIVGISVQNSTGSQNKAPKQAVPVIKNGTVGSEAVIAQNDIVEYTVNKNNQVILMQVGNTREITGTFLSYEPGTATAKLSDKYNSYNLKVMPDSVITAQKIPVSISDIPSETPMTAVYQGDTLKSLDVNIPADQINRSETAAKILFADTTGKTLKIQNSYGDMQYLDIADNASIYINGERQTIDAIGYDQDAVLELADNKVVAINIYSDLPESEPSQDVFTGRVRDVVGSNIMVSKDTEPDKQVTFNIDENTVIIKDTNSVDKSVIRQGDRFKAYNNPDEGNYISRIELADSGITLTNIYKGDIKEVLSNNEVILTNVYTYGFYDWVKQGDYLRFKLSDEASLYQSNQKLEPAQLKDKIGQTIYAASQDNYGEEQVVQAILKDGYEDSLYKTIKDIKWTENQLTLSDSRIVNFSDGAIVVKDGKLLDTLDLSNDASAFIIQNKTTGGASTTPVICLDSANGFLNYRISEGYLHNMGEDYYTVENGYRLTNNDWEKWGEFIFQLSNETYILDNVVTQSVITADKFAESRYMPYTYTWPDFQTGNYSNTDEHKDDKYHKDYEHYSDSAYYHEHCKVYTITDENGMTKAINIAVKDKESWNPDFTHTERMTAGKVDTVNTLNSLLTIKSAMDYSQTYAKWQPLTVTVPVDAATAVILKNGEPVTIDDISPNDSIYVLSDNGSAVFIFIE